MSKAIAFLISGVLFSGALHALEIEIGAYNVHNLFDDRHDAGKRDFEFLPLNNPDRIQKCEEIMSRRRPNSRDVRKCEYPIDWNQEKIKMKLSKIKDVFDIRGQRQGSSGLPQILSLSEIENVNIVTQLAEKLGYRKVVVTNGPDKRGIDLALLFTETANLKFVRAKSYEVNIGFPTRPILQVEFEVIKDRFKTPLVVYVNHWPAQNGRSNSRPRVLAAKKLRELMQKKALESPKARQIAMGDFNVIPSEKPHPFGDELLRSSRNELKLLDVHSLYEHAVNEGEIADKYLPRGTYYWGGSNKWRLLDRFIVSKNMLDQRGMNLQLSSYEIFFDTRISQFKEGVGWHPHRYNHYTTNYNRAGFSDHYPIFVKLKL